MQKINKNRVKSIFSYTWYMYPLAAVISIFAWRYAFEIYHQPSSYQKIEMFIGAYVSDQTFKEDIRSQFDKEQLREFNIHSCQPDKKEYASKLNVTGLSNADLLILPEKTITEMEGYLNGFFIPFSDEIVNTYVGNNQGFITENEERYALKYKAREDNDHWLKSYIGFEEGVDYYLLIGSTSKNITEEHNNALKVIDYLIHGVTNA